MNSLESIFADRRKDACDGPQKVVDVRHLWDGEKSLEDLAAALADPGVVPDRCEGAKGECRMGIGPELLLGSFPDQGDHKVVIVRVYGPLAVGLFVVAFGKCG